VHEHAAAARFSHQQAQPLRSRRRQLNQFAAAAAATDTTLWLVDIGKPLQLSMLESKCCSRQMHGMLLSLLTG
jgi:hypothetical protein